MTFRLSLLALLSLASSAALGHPGEHAGGLAHGVAHPFLGLDHLLAMVIVGVWAVRSGGRVWLLPCVFVTFMAIGAALGSVVLPYVEPMIMLSVLVFALATVAAKNLPAWLGGAVVALFALCHGHAHFTEMPDTSTGGFLAGMLLATALLHLLGVGIALLATRLRARASLRAGE
jgi:urease accessory protein